MVVMVAMVAMLLLGLTQRLPVCVYLNKGDFIRLPMVGMVRVSGSMVREGKTWS